MSLTCPKCQSHAIKKNGTIHNGKQKYACLSCHRQFVETPTNKIISAQTKENIKKVLLERVSLEGVCRIFDVSMPWLLKFVGEVYKELPEDLNVKITSHHKEVIVIETQIDEMWSYVGNKENKQWIWMVLDVKSRQILAFHVGDRSKNSAAMLMEKLPGELKKNYFFYTDYFSVYSQVIAKEQHSPVGKGSGKTNYIERFNCTLRQRCSRLVRKTLSFSKKLINHIGAIKYFICHYNKKITALHA